MTTAPPHNTPRLHVLVHLAPLHLLSQAVRHVVLALSLSDGKIALRRPVLNPQLPHLHASKSPGASP